MRRSAPGGARGTTQSLDTAKSRRRGALVAGVILGSVALTGCFGAGSYRVTTPLRSTQMPPGLWRSLGGANCTWTRYTNGSQVAGTNVRTNGPQYMQLPDSDSSVSVGNCYPFWQQPGAFVRPLVQPGSPFGDGDFLVGYEVATGTYVSTATAGQTCTWAVVQGFHGNTAGGNNPDIVRGTTTNKGAPTAIIRAGDFGFTSQGCGQWNLTGPAPPPPTPAPPTPAPPTVPTLPVAPGGAVASTRQISGTNQDFPDPFVLRVDNPTNDPTICGGAATCYYAYATESGFLGLLNVPVARSTDLTTWNWAGPDLTGGPGGTPDGNPDRDAMPDLAPWVAFGKNWAPSVLARPDNPDGQQYVMYYTAQSKANSVYGGRQCVGIATAASPDGPFVDTSTAPVICRTTAGGTIDASPFVASDGTVYLTYSDDVGIRAQRLTSNGLSLFGGEQLLMRFDTGLPFEFPRIEGPTMFTASGAGIVLLYSAGNFDNSKYSVGAARCDTPLGPCRNIYSTPVLASRGSSMLGPGGQTPFQLPDGSWRIAFHAWNGVVGYPNGSRTLRILPLTFPGGNPAIG